VGVYRVWRGRGKEKEGGGGRWRIE